MSGESPEYYKTLTLKQAKELAQHGEEGDLWLRGLTKLSHDTAKALARYAGSLHLDGLTNVSDDVAKARSKHNNIL